MTKQTPTVLAVAFSLLLLAIAPLGAEPLPRDARIMVGKLENGVRWMYRQHDNPPGKMAASIHVRTGSLNETDQQRGLAHFMEHMVFNGTENFAPGELIKYYESIGVEFGADLNAGTGFDRTKYDLLLPDTKTATIDKALMTLSDYAFRALLLDEEIDKERGIILEEKRTGQNYRERIRDKLWPELFAGSRLARRMIIGTEEVISSAPRSEFVDYYRTWYRPENITVILVGDAAADVVKPLIKKWFGEYRAARPAKRQHTAEFTPFAAERAIVVTDPELARGSVSLYNLRPGRPPTVSPEQWRQELVEYIGAWIVNRRCQERVQKGEASYLFAGAAVYNMFNNAMFVNARAGGEPGKWANMLEETIMEVNRAQEHGFTRRELELAKKEILADAEHAVETEPTRNSRGMLNGIARAVTAREPVLSAEQELELFRKMLPSLSLQEVSRTFKSHFQPGTFAYVVQMPEKEGIEVPSRESVMAGARAAWARKVAAPREEEAPTELLTTMPTPGTIVESALDQDLGITSAWLDNGVRVHHRFMDYKKDQVLVSVSLVGGGIEETAATKGITEAASLAVSQAATSRLSSTNIRDLLTGKNVSVRADTTTDDSLTLFVSGSPKDLESGFQLVHALLTDGKIEESAFDTWKRATIQEIDQGQSSPIYKIREASRNLLSGGDPRRLLLTKADLEALSVNGAQAWFDRLRREAPIEVAVVGDLQLEDAMRLVLKYVGGLSKRGRSAAHLDGLRGLSRTTGPLARRVEVDTISPQAVALAGFVGCDGRNVAEARALDLAANIIDSRMNKRIREELALVYSIQAFNAPSWVYRDAGLFAAWSMCDPKNADNLAEEIHKILKDFAHSGPSAEELDAAKLQIANNLDIGMREPGYWMQVLQFGDLHGRSLEEEKRHKEAYASLAAAQVQAAVKKYYTPEREFSITAAPVKDKARSEIKEPATATTP